MSYQYYQGVMIPLVKPMSDKERYRFNEKHCSSMGVNYDGTLIYVLHASDFVEQDRHELIFVGVPEERELLGLKKKLPVDCEIGKALCFETYHFDTVDNPLDTCTLEQFLEAHKKAT